MNTKAKGYLLGAVAAATYGMNPLFALPLYKEGMDPDSVLFSAICSPFRCWGPCSASAGGATSASAAAR